MTKQSLLSKLRKAEIIVRKPVTLRGGDVSDYYVDIKKAYGDPKLLAEVAGEIADNLNPVTTCLAVSGYGGIPLGVAVSQLTNLPLSLVRRGEKDHGKGGVIDGYVPNKKDVVSILDDVFTVGTSLKQTIESLSGVGLSVIGCHVVVSRGNTQGFSLPISYLFNSDDLV